MHQVIHKENPFGLTPKGLLWELLVEDNKKHPTLERLHLDFGTRDGSMLKALKDTALSKKE